MWAGSNLLFLIGFEIALCDTLRNHQVNLEFTRDYVILQKYLLREIYPMLTHLFDIDAVNMAMFESQNCQIAYSYKKREDKIYPTESCLTRLKLKQGLQLHV